MVVRKRRKKNKMRGNRTHGAGDTKHRRGAGSRGGRGRAGSHKHKYSLYYKDFGVKRKLKPKAKAESVNLEFISGKIPAWIENGKAKKEGGLVIINGKVLGFGKILGGGNISEKIKVLNAAVSEKAAEKISRAGGLVEGAESSGVESEPLDAEEGEEEETR